MIEGENKENKGGEKIAYCQTKLHHLSCQQEQQALSCQAPKKFPLRLFHMHLKLRKLHNEWKNSSIQGKSYIFLAFKHPFLKLASLILYDCPMTKLTILGS